MTYEEARRYVKTIFGIAFGILLVVVLVVRFWG